MAGKGGQIDVDLRVAPPAQITVNGAPWAGWTMTRECPGRAERGDLFGYLSTWAYRALQGPAAAGFPGLTEPPPPGESRELRWKMSLVDGRLGALSRHAIRCCEPAVRRLALAFPLGVRFQLYQRFLADRTGRLAQMAHVSPGTLLFALALLGEPDADMEALGEAVVRDVLRGRRLGRLLEEAVAGWSAGARARAAREATRFRPGEIGAAVWARVADASPEEGAWIRARQRLLIRRAASRVEATLLWLPPPLAFAPEDVPAAARANERWFRVMKSSWVTLWLRPRAAETRQLALCAFASRHAEALYDRGGRARGVSRTLGRLMDYLEGTGRAPGCKADPARLLEACEGWHRWVYAIVGDDMVRALDLCREHVLPTPPVSGWQGDGVEVVPIRKLGDLVWEGLQMGHCVATHAWSVMQGNSFVYSAKVHGRRLTIELVRTRSGSLELADLAGHANRPPTNAEVEALWPWLEAALGA
jgi:hypothetical protein